MKVLIHQAVLDYLNKKNKSILTLGIQTVSGG
jgi:hypothetical protein